MPGLELSGELWQELNIISILARMVLAMLSGGVLGVERGRTNQPAGMRTHMLVCMGAALVMMTGQYCFQQFGTGDPARLGAQVVSGIGFLGAGSIVSTKTKVKGLTTAAGLWAAASIGLGIGIGFYFGAVAATGASYLIVTKLRTMENRFTANDTWLQCYVRFQSLDVLPDFSEKIRVCGLQLGEIQLNKKQSREYCAALITIKNPLRKSREEVADVLTGQDGVQSLVVL